MISAYFRLPKRDTPVEVSNNALYQIMAGCSGPDGTHESWGALKSVITARIRAIVFGSSLYGPDIRDAPLTKSDQEAAEQAIRRIAKVEPLLLIHWASHADSAIRGLMYIYKEKYISFEALADFTNSLKMLGLAFNGSPNAYVDLATEALDRLVTVENAHWTYG